MTCPKCKGKVKVLDVVNNPNANLTYRKRKCKKCGYEFGTIEETTVMDAAFKKAWHLFYRKSKEELK